MKFKGSIIITDPCYIAAEIISNDDWGLCEYGENMEVLGISPTHLVAGTIYGDWSCTTFNTDTKEPIGRFCADAGLVGVFLLEDVLKYNPDFNYHTERTWTATLIEDFDGEVEIVTETDEDGDEAVHVVGTGNINFKTFQSGF